MYLNRTDRTNIYMGYRQTDPLNSKAVSLSLAVLTVTAFAQAFIYYRTLSVALLADLIHNFGDALTAVPLGIAFYLRSARGER